MLNNRTSVHMKQKLTQFQFTGGIDKPITIVGDFNTCLSKSDRTSRQKVSKDTKHLNSNIDQLDLIDIYKTLYSTAEYALCSNTHGTFPKIDLI